MWSNIDIGMTILKVKKDQKLHVREWAQAYHVILLTTDMSCDL